MKSLQAQWKMDSIIGPLFLVASEQGLQCVLWKKQKVEMLSSLSEDSAPARFLAQAVQELNEFLNGQRQSFTVALDIQGTEFQKRVWRELCKIPYGKTLSYKDVAAKVKTNGIRAVGTANGRNPLSIIVPCHRVIASNGTLGGYAGGLPIKTRLLELEKQISAR
ncbi:methylated-DNA--[protein]-cysteine S-methyltransferase [Bdellovibrio sp. 22V]|uniref:methylated-DNA--[protein]-cysteine S-methyltransferase n=1 Tax=Bdellovibrio TaxID=958 RepID=UPI002542E6C6|nr:methylated-DNA--[protein]-cysteine S-methyltransferase [Bdellovibrio sp. 22V]WII73917.1 methylated-DNA--[protein]-cysteine S-methyltransferase [Bdellovibrio sp. 22V]